MSDDILNSLRMIGCGSGHDAQMEDALTASLAYDEIKRLRAEVEEQARLNGMGVERELAAEAEIKRLQKALATYACRCGGGAQ